MDGFVKKYYSLLSLNCSLTFAKSFKIPNSNLVIFVPWLWSLDDRNVRFKRKQKVLQRTGGKMFVPEGNYPRCHLKDLLNTTVKFGVLPGNRLINVHQNVTWWGRKKISKQHSKTQLFNSLNYEREKDRTFEKLEPVKTFGFWPHLWVISSHLLLAVFWPINELAHHFNTLKRTHVFLHKNRWNILF